MLVYLDNSSTTKQYDEVTELMYKISKETFGNPSSLHSLGLAAEKEVKNARDEISKALGVKGEELFFTSCGTEADNTAIFGTVEAKKRRGNKIIVSKVEHPAVLEPAKKLEEQGYKVSYIGVDDKCHLNLDELRSEIDEDTILISVMSVNNETGTIMPIDKIVDMRENRDIIIHTDLVQGFGKIDLNLNSKFKGVDLVSLSAHKIHGPKGMGALYVRKGSNIKPFILGGGQESHFRSGTENVQGIAGFGLASKMANDNFEDRIAKMSKAREYLLHGIESEIKDIRINSPLDDTACPSVLNISFLGTRGEVLLHTLEQDGIFISTGSACSSNHASQKGSHVLNAMGLKPKEIEGAIRFSFSEFNTIEEMDYTLDKLVKAVSRFRKLGTFR